MRTKSWKNNPEFDNLLAECSISSLRFLEHKYKKDLKECKSKYFKGEVSYADYRQKEILLGMIREEIRNREYDLSTISKYRLSVSNWNLDPEDYYAYYDEDYEHVYAEYTKDY